VKPFDFQDVIKRSVLETGFITDVSIINMFIGLTVALLISLFIFQIYKATFNGVLYSHNFNITLILLNLVTCLIIMTISSNIVLSLGMVGALSIVRFRAAIKDPKDIGYLFWSISGGITAGAGMYTLGIGSSIFIGVVLLIAGRRTAQVETYLLIIKYNKSARHEVLEIVNKLKYELKSKVARDDVIEMTIEVRKIGQNTSYVDVLTDIDGVMSAVLVKYTGEYAE